MQALQLRHGVRIRVAAAIGDVALEQGNLRLRPLEKAAVKRARRAMLGESA